MLLLVVAWRNVGILIGENEGISGPAPSEFFLSHLYG